MKVYSGSRTIDGIVVLVDGKPLDGRYGLKRFTTTGFEWTYEGAGPAQLALALLADHLDDDGKALDLCPNFMRSVSRQSGERLGVDGRRHRPGP